MRRFPESIASILHTGLGAFWLYGGVSKLWSGFDAAPFLHAAVEKAQAQPPAVLPFMGRIVCAIALPAAPVINVAVPWIEIAIGLGFLVSMVDRRVRLPTLTLAGFLSILFLACGASGWNPILLGAVLLLAFSEGNGRRRKMRRWMGRWQAPDSLPIDAGAARKTRRSPCGIR